LEYHDNVNQAAAWTELTSTGSAAVIAFQHDLTTPFPANLDQSDYFVKYRVSAINGIGYGVTSEIAVLTKTYPRKMDIVSIADPIPSEINISWSKLTTSDSDTGRDPILHYQVEWIK
jgi:hypothetical protein